MPRGDRTGPMGMGKMTGRGLGVCGANNGWGENATLPLAAGRGWGLRCGRGMGVSRNFFGRRFENAQVTSQGPSYQQNSELSLLKNQARYFGDVLESLQKRISELEANKANSEE